MTKFLLNIMIREGTGRRSFGARGRSRGQRKTPNAKKNPPLAFTVGKGKDERDGGGTGKTGRKGGHSGLSDENTGRRVNLRKAPSYGLGQQK